MYIYARNSFKLLFNLLKDLFSLPDEEFSAELYKKIMTLLDSFSQRSLHSLKIPLKFTCSILV